MKITITDNSEHRLSRKGRYQKANRIFHARVNLLESESFCVRPHLYLCYWDGDNNFTFGVGDEDDCDIYVHIPFSETALHELLNLMTDYESAYITYNDACNLVEDIKNNFIRT